MPTLEQLVADLKRDRLDVSAGRFSIDNSRARELLRRYRLADPNQYVLRLVQAAVVKGATKVRFDIDADDMHVLFDGASFSAAELRNLYRSFLDDEPGDPRTARYYLAIGIHAATAFEPRWIRIISGDGKEGACLEVRPGREDVAKTDVPAPKGTEIHVKRQADLKLVQRFFMNIGGTLPEEVALRKAAKYSPISIDLKGNELSIGMDLGAEALVSVPLTGRKLRGVVGWRRPGRKLLRPIVHFLCQGVLTETFHPDQAAAFEGLVAIVESPSLRLDVSQARLVRDRAFESSVATILSSQLDLLDERASRAGEHPHGGWDALILADFLRLVEWFPSPKERCGRSRFEGRHRLFRALKRGDAKRLSAFPVCRTIQGDTVLLGTLVDLAISREPVFYARATLTGYSKERLVLHVETEATHRLLRSLGTKLQDLTEDIKLEKQWAVNRNRWRKRRQAPVLSRAPCLLRRRIESGGLKGEVAIRASGSDELHWSVVKDGCLLTEIRVQYPIPGIDAIVEGDFAPTRDFLDVKRDSRFAAAAAALLDAAVEIFDDLAESLAGTEDIEGWSRTSLLSFLFALARPDALSGLCAPLGLRPQQLLGSVPAWLPPSLQRLVNLEAGGAHDGTHRVHSAFKLRLLPTLDGRRVSAIDICFASERGWPLQYVHEDETRFLAPAFSAALERPVADNRSSGTHDAVSAGPGLLTPLVLDSQGQTFVEHLTGRIVSHAHEIEFGNEVFLVDPVCRALFASTPCVSVAFQQANLAGLVAAPVTHHSHPAHQRLVLALLHGHGKLAQVSLPFPGGPLVAMACPVGEDAAKAWANCDVDDILDTFLPAFVTAFPLLIEQFVQNGLDRSPRAVIRLVRLACALFPSPEFRLAYETMLNEAGECPKDGEDAYTRLLTLVYETSWQAVRQALPDPVVCSMLETINRAIVPAADGTLRIDHPFEPRGEITAEKHAMFWVDAVFPIGDAGTPPTYRERTLLLVDPLRTARLFRRWSGEEASLEEILETYREHGRILVAGSTHGIDRKQPGAERAILLEPMTRAIILSVLGRDALKDVSQPTAHEKRGFLQGWIEDGYPRGRSPVPLPADSVVAKQPKSRGPWVHSAPRDWRMLLRLRHADGLEDGDDRCRGIADGENASDDSSPDNAQPGRTDLAAAMTRHVPTDAPPCSDRYAYGALSSDVMHHLSQVYGDLDKEGVADERLAPGGLQDRPAIAGLENEGPTGERLPDDGPANGGLPGDVRAADTHPGNTNLDYAPPGAALINDERGSEASIDKEAENNLSVGQSAAPEFVSLIPDERLVDAVLETLARARPQGDGADTLLDANLARLGLHEGPADLAVIADDVRCFINRAHPMVKMALEQGPDERIWVSFLCSAAYTALNTWLEKVTDKHEAQFLHNLVSALDDRDV